MNRVRFNNGLIINQNINQNNTSKSTSNLVAEKKSFQEILHSIEKKENVKFSKHAMERLKIRNIKLSESDINKISGAIQRAEKKGVREALILMDNKAFVASVKNKTIITAASNEQLKENIFTNIDGAVII